MSAAEAIWTWLTVSIYLVGALTTAYYLIQFAALAYEGWKRERKDATELKRSAQRASEEQEETAISIRQGVK